MIYPDRMDMGTMSQPNTRPTVDVDEYGIDVTFIHQDREITPTFVYSLSRVNTKGIDFDYELITSRSKMGSETRHLFDPHVSDEHVVVNCFTERNGSELTKFVTGDRVHIMTDEQEEYDGLYETYGVEDPDWVTKPSVEFVDSSGEELRLSFFRGSFIPIE